MAGSKYAYVKNFELADILLPSTYLVVRIDGHGFHRFSEEHGFDKPNDTRALQLMDAAATAVMKEYPDITLAFGESDEYSFLLRQSTTLYNRRSSKISSTVVSLFTSNYVLKWSTFFPNQSLKYAPSFDGRVVAYPAEKHVRDYFAWRQADTHINNLYNTTFWALVLQGKKSTTQAHAELRGTSSAKKNEILFKQFEINYNQVAERFRKGSIIVRIKKEVEPTSLGGNEVQNDPGHRPGQPRPKFELVVKHCDLIGDAFWREHDLILS